MEGANSREPAWAWRSAGALPSGTEDPSRRPVRPDRERPSWSPCRSISPWEKRNMAQRGKPILILMADDDEDDRNLTREALRESRLANEIRFVFDGEQLMDYLHRRGDFAGDGAAPRPGVILLDLNMPKKDGREALKEIKSHPG